MKLDLKTIPLIFNVYKPPGPSSFSIVQHFKKNLDYNFGKIGHFGTLDPFAEGVLLIGVQGAQKLNDYIHELLPKTYMAIGQFGVKTNTGDFTSAIIQEKEIEKEFQNYTHSQMEEKLSSYFLGEYWQAPHSFSASKFEGKRLYHLALQGKIINKEKVKREILDLKILKYSYPFLEFVVTVSSGTYVRSLFEEISEIMGGVGTLKTLKRKAIGEHTFKDSMFQKDWPLKNNIFSLEAWGKTLDLVLILNTIILNDFQTSRYVQGHRFNFLDLEIELKNENLPVLSPHLFWIYHKDGELLGLGKKVGEELHVAFNLNKAISQFL